MNLYYNKFSLYFFLFTTVYSCPQKKTGGAAAPSAPPVPVPLVLPLQCLVLITEKVFFNEYFLSSSSLTKLTQP